MHFAAFVTVGVESASAASALPRRASLLFAGRATDTVALVRAGGPFPYSQDGEVYQNRQGLLPTQSASYYTVPTPGTSGRGERRLVAGAEEYYSADDYAGFCAVGAA